MPDRLHQVEDFRDLLKSGDGEGPYLYSKIFSDAGWLARRLSRQKLKLLRRIDEAIRPMLEEGERVFMLTRGTKASFWESYFLGVMMQYLNRRAIVLTTKRILLLQTTWRGWPRDYRSEIWYQSIARVKPTLLGNTKITFRDGKSVLFAGVPRQDRKLLRALIERLSKEPVEAAPANQGIVDLCPHCYGAVFEPMDRCPNCEGLFKSSKTAGVLSLLFPGVGDFYLGHRSFAVLEVMVTAFLWVAIFLAALDPSMGAAAVAIVGVFFFLLVHGIDAMVTAYIGRKGLIAETSGRRVLRWYGIATLPPVIIAAGLGTVGAAKAGLRPAASAVSGADLPEKHRKALIRAGHVTADEEIVYFYSNGRVSVLEDGNLVTDRRVISYELDAGSLWYESADYQDVVDLDSEFSLDPQDLTTITVEANDGRAFRLIVSPAGGRDTAFVTALQGYWSSNRDRRAR